MRKMLLTLLLLQPLFFTACESDPDTSNTESTSKYSYSQNQMRSQDFWLSHPYYASAADYKSGGAKLSTRKPYVELIDGGELYFDYINLSKGGRYNVKIEYDVENAGDSGAEMSVEVNDKLVESVTVNRLTSAAPATILVNAEFATGMNCVAFKHEKNHLLIRSITLQKDDSATNVVATITSGELKINLYDSGEGYGVNFEYNSRKFVNYAAGAPITIDIDKTELSAMYNQWREESGTLYCSAEITSSKGSQFSVEDAYIPSNDGEVELQRSVVVTRRGAGEKSFNTNYGFNIGSGSMLDNDYFIPGVMYKGNFHPNSNLPSKLPQVTSKEFLYRGDRTPLPMVVTHQKGSGNSIAIIHKDSNPTTVMADNNKTAAHLDYQYGAVGVLKGADTYSQLFIYPGSEHDTPACRGGWRSHPISTDVKHSYNLLLKFSKSESYAEVVTKAWNRAVELYDPTIYTVDMEQAYNGLIATLNKYYVPSREQGGVRDAPGFPFQVDLSSFMANGISYQMGFVGMQLPSGYYLFREGVESSNAQLKGRGEAILDFWANKSLTALGAPRAWYDPATNGTGKWRKAGTGGENIRVLTGGMEGLLTAWCFAKRNAEEHSSWLDATKRFGDWLLAIQNSDGSFYFAYDLSVVENGAHPILDYNKYLTICTVRYLVELHIATGESKYKDAALRAGEWCYTNIHEPYHYFACVVDNNRTIDSESGQMSLNGFLALYDLTGDNKWLEAAEQAATYNESWVYLYEIPVESDRLDATDFPRTKSIIGQHLIAIGHSAADLGFAWSAFAYYRLYIATGDEHYLTIARVSAHNTKQSLNWDNSVFPGQAKGLQLEAFQVGIPRRCNGIMQSLNWNYAAHLDPMFRFKDAFGSIDLEEIEQLPLAERQAKAKKYAKVQSSDWGQTIN